MEVAYCAEFIASGAGAPRGAAKALHANLCPTTRKHATIVFMGLAIFAMRLLELMFFAGLAGSTVVVLISFIEDGKELFGKDED
jgi:hypothetical protein